MNGGVAKLENVFISYDNISVILIFLIKGHQFEYLILVSINDTKLPQTLHNYTLQNGYS